MKKKKLFLLLSGILFLIVAVSAGAILLLFTFPIPDYTGNLTLKGLTAPVTVHTDDHGIPHIQGKSEEDLFFAQGYITARERMFQMDIARLAGRGELSLLFGERTIDKDRFLKTLGFYRRAIAGFQALPDETKKILRSYAAGVNAYIRGTDHLPAEYFFLGGKPGLWKPEDSVAIGLLMSYSLTRSKKIDLVLHQAREKAGDEVLKKLIPHFPDFAPRLNASPSSGASESHLSTLLPFTQEKKKIIDMVDEIISFDIPASNWMIFSGKMTTSGKPILSGSPDLAPTLPALFYKVHLMSGKYNATGGSVPGVPGIGPLGFNGHIAWSTVNGRGDELDYFIERINPKNPMEYLTERGYEKFKIITETLKIKEGDTIREEKLTVKITRHGPMISDVLPLAPKNCAMQWAGLELPCTDIAGLIGMNRAENFQEFRRAHQWIRTMNLGFGYADKRGNIGWAFTSSPPLRKKGDGTLPVPGWTGEYDWKGYIPHSNVPWRLNPPEGFVASFNNAPTGIPSPMSNYCLFERAIRFQEMSKDLTGKKLSHEDIRRLQLDTVSVVAKRWLPLIAEAGKKSDDGKGPASLLASWDASFDIESHEATLFALFYLYLMENTLSDEVGEKIWKEELSHPYLFYVPDLLLARIAEDTNNSLYDDRNTGEKIENRDDIIRKSLIAAWKELKEKYGSDPDNWKWGKVHQMYFKHPLGSKLSFFNLSPIPVNGDHHTINSGFWDSEKKFHMKSGGVIRIIIDFGNIENSSIISPPGQSGHFLSAWYDDTAELWAAGKQVPLHFSSWEKLERKLVLNP